MTVRRINIAVFLGLASLVFFSGQLRESIYIALTCVLLVIFTSGTISDFILLRKWNQLKLIQSTLFVVLGLFMGFLSSMIIGTQRHDVYDGGPSLGMATWIIPLTIVYPISFFIFVFSISRLASRPAQFGLLFTWVIATVIYGYFFGDDYASFYKNIENKGMYYDSVYFPSETRNVTLLLVLTVLFWTLLIMIKERWVKTSSRQQNV